MSKESLGNQMMEQLRNFRFNHPLMMQRCLDDFITLRDIIKSLEIPNDEFEDNFKDYILMTETIFRVYKDIFSKRLFEVPGTYPGKTHNPEMFDDFLNSPKEMVNGKNPHKDWDLAVQLHLITSTNVHRIVKSLIRLFPDKCKDKEFIQKCLQIYGTTSSIVDRL